MKKGRNNYDDELYEDDDYNDDYDDDYYGEEYEEEEDEKPRKKTNKNKNDKKPQNNNNNNKNNQQKNPPSNPQNQNKNKQPQNQNKNKQPQNQNKLNSLDITKKESSISSSSIPLSVSSNTSISTSTKEKEKNIKTITDLNNLESYPTIDYGAKYTSKEEKPSINIVIIGHVDSGKSTMIGHLLSLLNVIDKKILKNKLNIGSNTKETIQYAFATDEASSERERGVTIDIGFKNFETKTKNVVALDAPGHQDFIPNMIAGTSAADYALLVIDSGIHDFDAGFYGGGRTKEHALLAKTLGVSKIIVAINKLELFNWEEKRYNELVEVLEKYLVEELGFNDKDIYFIPTSGKTGDNLIKPIESKKAKWYNGPVLIDLIDNLPAPVRAIDGPVRFIINDISKNTMNGLQGINLYGKLDSGIISVNKEYIIYPSLNKLKIKALAVNNTKVDYITPGQQADILLNTNKNTKDEIIIENGNVLSSEKYPIPCVKKFKAHIKTYDLTTPITLGQKMMFYLQGQQKQITIKKIERIFNEGSKVSRNNTKFIPKNFYADIIIHSEDKICAELFKLNKRLSTFALRIKDVTQAMGYITEFLESE